MTTWRSLGLWAVVAAPASMVAKVLVGSALWSLAPQAASPAAAADAETPVGIIAAQIRRQGYTCDKPKSAKRDPAASEPNQEVWILTCEAETYRVELIPDMAAKVERID